MDTKSGQCRQSAVRCVSSVLSRLVPRRGSVWVFVCACVRACVRVSERESGGHRGLGSQQLLPPPLPAEVTPDGLPSQSTTLAGLALPTGGGGWGTELACFLGPAGPVRSGAPLRGGESEEEAG